MPHPSDIVERLAQDLSALAWDMRVQARTVSEVERRTEEGERIAAALRAVFRGR